LIVLSAEEQIYDKPSIVGGKVKYVCSLVTTKVHEQGKALGTATT